ncbi:MAG: hypothetical protein Q4C70_03350 [Planctomycetia bacterium]|nr:hypothetical protein [Planctomycetia bacterium]
MMRYVTITRTRAGSIYLGQVYNGLTVNVNQGTYVENGIANSANIMMTADSTHDLNGKSATVDTLIGKYVNTCANYILSMKSVGFESFMF